MKGKNVVYILLAIDQLVNTLTYAKGEGFGFPDEALSSRAWRLRKMNSRWGAFHAIVDLLFRPIEKDHCFNSFKSEILFRQFPSSYYRDAMLVYAEIEKNGTMGIDEFIRSFS